MSIDARPAMRSTGVGTSPRRPGIFARRRTSNASAVRARPTAGERVLKWGPLAALLLLCMIFAWRAERFATVDNLKNVLDQSAVLSIATVGITFVLLLGAIDLSMEGVMSACVMVGALLVMNSRNANDWGLFAVIPVVLVGAAFGLANGLITTRLKVPSFMTTVGMSAVGLGVAQLLFDGDQPRVLDRPLRAWVIGRVFGFTRATLIAVVCIAIGVVIQRHTRLGRYATAIGSAEDIVALSGVNVRRYKALAFALAGAFYSIAAVLLFLKQGTGNDELAVNVNFAAITAAVVGGTLLSGGQGGVLQSIVGVLIVKVLENGLLLLDVQPALQRAVQGVIVVGAVVAATWPLRHRLRVVK